MNIIFLTLEINFPDQIVSLGFFSFGTDPEEKNDQVVLTAWKESRPLWLQFLKQRYCSFWILGEEFAARMFHDAA
ncbi:unnamed protein product [Allacma fusca]|uniref:Uncharacterized protein n=1 Tax=Allacma fusca TaxID=39272 RepID=A0A8J2K7E3_9HEXA|nr:unnamed protein product [Allacma fusca]